MSGANEENSPVFHSYSVRRVCRNIKYFHFTLFLNTGKHNTALLTTSLQWRRNERDSVSNRQPCDCLLNCFSGRRSKKTSKLRVTGLCEGNSPVTDEFPAQKAYNAENVSIWWRHHIGCWGPGDVWTAGINSHGISMFLLQHSDFSTRKCYILGLWLDNLFAWWRYQMETVSALLAFCAGNSPVTSEFPSQRPVTRRFDDLISAWINGWVHNRGAGDLRRHRTHYDIIVMENLFFRTSRLATPFISH